MQDAALSPKFIKLANDLVGALTSVTGETWTVAIRYNDDGLRKGEFLDARFARADGFTIAMWSGGYRAENRAEFMISWPKSPDGRSRTMRDAPGVSYSAVSPTATSDIARAPTTIAKQIVKTLMSDTCIAAWKAMIVGDAAERQRVVDAYKWNDAVAQVSHMIWRESNSGEIYWSSPKSGSREWASIKSSKYSAGGSITINLPSDPTEAAILVAKLRAAAVMDAEG